MSKPNNLIAKVKIPGETGPRPIIPYEVGSTGHNYTAKLPDNMTADDNLVINNGPLPKITIASPDTKLYEFATTHTELLNKEIVLDANGGSGYIRGVGAIKYTPGPHIQPYTYEFTDGK